MSPHSVSEPSLETLPHSTEMSRVDENDYAENEDHEQHHLPQQYHHDDSEASMDSDTFREQRRRIYEVCQTDEELFAQHNNNIQSIFDNRHHEIQFEQDDIQSAAGGGGEDGSSIGGGSSLGGYSNMSYNDNSTQGSVRTREELRLSLIARRRRLAQLENAMDEEGSLDLSLKLNRSERDGDNSLMSSVSLNESITDSLIARIMGRKKTKKKIKDDAEKKKSKDKKSSSKNKDKADDKEGEKDKTDQKKDREKKKKSKNSKRHKDKEKSQKPKKSEKKHRDEDKKSRRRSSRRHSNSSSEDDSSSSESENDDNDEHKKRRSNQHRQHATSSRQRHRSSANYGDGVIDKSRAKQMMAMGGKTIQKLKQMAPTSSAGGANHPPTTSTDRQQQQHQHHNSSSTGVVYFACNEATGMCAFHPDVQLRKKSMFGGWNDVLKQCPKCMSESYSKGGGGGGGQHFTAARHQMPGGGTGMRQSSEWRGSGGVTTRNIPNRVSDGRMRSQPSADQRGGMYRGQQQSSLHRTPSDTRMMPSFKPHPTSYRGGDIPSQRQYQGQSQQRGGDSSKYPGASGAPSKPIPRNATVPTPTSRQHQHQSDANQFYSSLHFLKTQDVIADQTSTSRRQSYPDAAYQGSTDANPLPQHYQHQKNPSISTSFSPPQYHPSSTKNPGNGRRAHFGADPPPSSSRPMSTSYKVANMVPKRVSIGDIEETPTPRQDDEYDNSYHHHPPHHSIYTCGDEGRKRDMIEYTNEAIALQRISNLKAGYPAFVRRSTGKWTFAKVKHISSDMIVFHVDKDGSSKAYNVKQWTSHIRALKVAGQDGW